MVVGASGGSRIISAVAQVVVRALIFNQTVKESVDAPRIHNQFAPFITEYEDKIPNVSLRLNEDTLLLFRQLLPLSKTSTNRRV